MRLSQFALTDEPVKPKQALYHATVEVVGKVSGRLSPVEINNLIVRFPLLNCAVSEVHGTAIRGTDDCGQHVGVTGNALQNLFAEQMFKGFLNSPDNFVDNDFGYFVSLLSKRFRVKNPAFQEEHEWRFMRDISSAEPKLKVHATADTLKPYISISLLGYTQNPIIEVILGPKNKTKETTLRYLLGVNGFSGVNIQSSVASYQ